MENRPIRTSGFSLHFIYTSDIKIHDIKLLEFVPAVKVDSLILLGFPSKLVYTFRKASCTIELNIPYPNGHVGREFKVVVDTKCTLQSPSYI